MHAVSLTPHAQYNFRTTLKSENHMQNGDAMQKKMQVVSKTPHAKYDTTCPISEEVRAAQASFTGNIY
jgi:hypothetical protein